MVHWWGEFLDFRHRLQAVDDWSHKVGGLETVLETVGRLEGHLAGDPINVGVVGM